MVIAASGAVLCVEVLDEGEHWYAVEGQNAVSRQDKKVLDREQRFDSGPEELESFDIFIFLIGFGYSLLDLGSLVLFLLFRVSVRHQKYYIY